MSTTDLTGDVREYVRRRFGHGTPLDAIRFEVMLEYGDGRQQEDQVLPFWTGFAQGQWDCGVLEPDVLRRVEEGLSACEGKARVRLERLLEKLRGENPKPRKRLSRITKPVYAPGDCLAVRLTSGLYGAALVLAEDTRPGHGQPNLVGVLRYREEEMPSREVFEARDWLVLTHHAWNGRPDLSWCWASGHPDAADRILRVGNIPLRQDDPKDWSVFGGWGLGDQVEHQHQWDSGIG